MTDTSFIQRLVTESKVDHVVMDPDDCMAVCQ
jgi:hypothetical protein